jgi:hypothetical protein
LARSGGVHRSEGGADGYPNAEMSTTRAEGEGSRDEEAERYRQAAEMVLDQLDWCVDYLREIRKPQIARAIARNQRHIRDRLREADRLSAGRD